MTQESELRRIGDMQIQHDEQFQARLWKGQRAGWLLLALLLVSASLGLFGNGPLSYKTVRSPDGLLTVEYQRFERKHTDTGITVRMRARGGWDLKINREFIDAIRLDRIQPEPTNTRLLEDGLLMHFETLSESGASEVILRQQYEKPGKIPAVFSAGSSQVSFRQFVYP